jgi:isoquinoline 1-oxidoreductase beta subunit
MNTALSRRTFLEASLLAGGGLMLGGALQLLAAEAQPTARMMNAWVRIDPANGVTLLVSQSEMGQGIMTTLPAILADELGADWSAVKMEFADFAPAYRHPTYQWMFTGNSESISAFHDLMRSMGAAAREMLISAAAARWNVLAHELTARSSQIWHDRTQRSLDFGALADAAAKLSPPKKPMLRAQRTLIGRSLDRVDVPQKVDGSAVFGIDVHLPNLVNATVSVSPVFGGTLLSFDRQAVLSSPGVLTTIAIPNGLAIVADSYWHARKALSVADIRWQEGELAAVDSKSLREQYARALNDGPFFPRHAQGEAKTLESGQLIRATYISPFQAHATMEPMNCTAHVTAERCELWVATQGVELTHMVAKQLTGLPDDRIVIHRTLLGGGFGRRLHGDFVKQAILIAKEVGRPVKLIWSREEDMTHDLYRPAVMHEIAASVDEKGFPTAMRHRIVSPSWLRYVFPRAMFPDLKDATQPVDPPQPYDEMTSEGVMHPAYGIPNYFVEENRIQPTMPVSVWRSTGHGPHNFAFESFVDELAHSAKIDPLEYRLHLAKDDARALRVLSELKSRSQWNEPLSKGESRGVALAKAFNGVVAQVVELAIDGENVKLKRVVAVVDCGTVLDPRIAESNIQGGIVWGLSALRTAITFDRGRVVESNFHVFDPLHLWETPKIEVHFVNSGAPLGGTGELGPVPAQAAFCNAVFAATGQRIRELPLSTVGLKLV